MQENVPLANKFNLRTPKSCATCKWVDIDDSYSSCALDLWKNSHVAHVCDLHERKKNVYEALDVDELKQKQQEIAAD